MIGELVAALRFLTVLPVPGEAPAGFGVRMFPVAGLLLGVLALAVDHSLLGRVPHALHDVLLAGFVVLVTGAIHLDGLADSLDGLGGKDEEERLRLMAEGSIGAYGVLGLVFAVAIRVSALAVLAHDGRTAALLVAPTLGRAAMVFLARGSKAARPGGLGEAFVLAVSGDDRLLVGLLALGVVVLIGGFAGALAAVVALAVVGWVRSLARKRLGGVTGDVIGATGELTELATLVVFAGLS